MDPTATPAAVEAILANNPGCFGCCVAGTELTGCVRGAGTFRVGVGGARAAGREKDLPPPPDREPRGISTLYL